MLSWETDTAAEEKELQGNCEMAGTTLLDVEYVHLDFGIPLFHP